MPRTAGRAARSVSPIAAPNRAAVVPASIITGVGGHTNAAIRGLAVEAIDLHAEFPRIGRRDKRRRARQHDAQSPGRPGRDGEGQILELIGGRTRQHADPVDVRGHSGQGRAGGACPPQPDHAPPIDAPLETGHADLGLSRRPGEGVAAGLLDRVEARRERRQLAIHFERQARVARKANRDGRRAGERARPLRTSRRARHILNMRADPSPTRPSGDPAGGPRRWPGRTRHRNSPARPLAETAARDPSPCPHACGAGCARKSAIARANGSTCSRGTTVMSSGKMAPSSTPPGWSAEMTGVPEASASTATVGSASSRDGRTNTSARRHVPRHLIVRNEPGHRHLVIEPERSAPGPRCASRSPPVPQITRRTSDRPRATAAKASIRNVWPASSWSRLDVQEHESLEDAGLAARRARRAASSGGGNDSLTAG